MARTQTEILGQINEAADRYVELASLQSNTSRVAVWSYVKNVAAAAIRSLEEGFDAHKKEVQGLLSNQQLGTLRWYEQQALSYQKGNTLTVQADRVFYAEDHGPEARIIKHAAVEEGTDDSAGTVYIKVVKDDPAGGGFEALTEDELTAFSAYMEALSFAGIKTEASSAAAVPISVKGTIQVDPQRLTTSGTSLSDPSRKPIEEALREYLRDLSFNGIIRRTALVDVIQATPGVVDVYVSELKHYATGETPGSGTLFKVTHKPSSGHATLFEPTALTYQTETISEPRS